MDRSRLPTTIGILHLISRATTLFLVHGSLTIALYLAITHAHINPILYTTLMWCAIVDTAEILALITKPEDGLGRVPTWLMFANETLVVSLYIVAYVVANNMTEDGKEEAQVEGKEEEWDEQMAWVYRLWLFVLLELVFRLGTVVIMSVDEVRLRRRLRGQFGGRRRGMGMFGRWTSLDQFILDARR